MRTLLVAATKAEIAPFIESAEFENSSVEYLISGIGMTFSTFELTKRLLENPYQLVINVGIGGSYSEQYPIGSLVQVIEDQFADLAYETVDGYESFFSSPFLDENASPFEKGKLRSRPYLPLTKALDTLPKVSGITVNKVHGQASSIALAKEKYNADTESMEGAAVFYVCKRLGVAVTQLRSISNFVEPRNKDNWDIPLAIGQLNIFLKNWLR